jgi:hypothetical protein
VPAQFGQLPRQAIYFVISLSALGSTLGKFGDKSFLECIEYRAQFGGRDPGRRGLGDRSPQSLQLGFLPLTVSSLRFGVGRSHITL